MPTERASAHPTNRFGQPYVRLTDGDDLSGDECLGAVLEGLLLGARWRTKRTKRTMFANVRRSVWRRTKRTNANPFLRRVRKVRVRIARGYGRTIGRMSIAPSSPMPSESSPITPRPLTVRSALTNDPLALRGVDGRSMAARRYRDVAIALADDLGGQDKLAEPAKILVRQAAALTIQAEALQSKIIAGDEVDLEQLDSNFKRSWPNASATWPQEAEPAAKRSRQYPPRFPRSTSRG